MNPIPVTILTGFLGSGKTTLLNRILRERQGHRIAVIENEFGEAGIDNELLVRDEGEQIIELNSGCICCTVRGDLVRILGELAAKRDAGTLRFDRVIIETTGLANPVPVAQTFFMDDVIAEKFVLDAIVTMVDAKHAQKQLDERHEAQEQVGFADRILITKGDLVAVDEMAALRQRLVKMNPRAKIGEARHGEASIEELLDIRGFNLNAILEIEPKFLADVDAEHDDDVTSFVFRESRPLVLERVEKFLGDIVRVYGTDLMRYKGVLNICNGDRRIVFQGVHVLMGSDFGAVWKPSENRESKMVFVGRDLPKDLLLAGLVQCIASAESIDATTPVQQSTPDDLASQAQFFHDAFSRWVDEPGVTIACGRWVDGAISEIMPGGRAILLPAMYDGCFSGVRELRLADQPHHLHIDFGRVHKMSYAIAPSVCLAFKPSFELRLLVIGPGGAPTDRWMVSLMLASPYSQGMLDHQAVVNFFKRARQDAAVRPELVECVIDPTVRTSSIAPQILGALLEATGQGSTTPWSEALGALCPMSPAASAEIEPACLSLLQHALALRDASLVIFRDRALIEFKTERLDGLHRYEEAGHVSWQIGAQDDHHCHLSLNAVTRVLFSAEPVSCQGGGLNFTVWFLSAGPSGNPYRRDGYFSIVLNRPYTGNAARREVIDPVLALYRRFLHEPWVQVDETFLQVLNSGPPDRHPMNEAERASA